MISLAALKLLPWRLIGKLAGVVVVASLLVWAFLLVKGWRDDAHALPIAEAARDSAIAETARVKHDWGKEVSRLQTVTKGLTDENETLRIVRAATPVRSVRLCPQAPAVPRDPAPSRGSDDTTTTTGILPPEAERTAGPEIGPEVFELMDLADEQSRLLRGAQTYIAGLPKECAL